MEVQLTEFENAAFSIFVVLLSRAILAFNLNFYIPISLNDANLQAAQKKDAILNEKFWFRRNIVGAGEDEFLQLNAHEIMNGNASLPMACVKMNSSLILRVESI